MARRYTRDNRGRFASGGGGATARGGRLKTAAGNKRQGQTMKAAGAGGAGVMKGAVKRDPGAMAKVGKAAPKAKDRAMRAAKNYQKAASAMSKGAMEKRTDVSLATASRALDVYRGKPITGKRSGFTSSGKRAAPAETRGRSLKPGEAIPRRTQAQAAKGVATARKAKALLVEKGGRTAPIGSRLSNAYSRAVVAETGNTNRLRALQMRSVAAGMKGAKIKVKPVTVNYGGR